MPSYNKLTPELISQIKAAVKGTVYEGGDINEDYQKDEMPIYGTHMPDLAVVAQSTEDVAAIVKICNENKIPVTPRGAGTGLVGAAVPVAGGVLIDMSKMNRILSYDLDNMVVTIEPGVLLQDLANDCGRQGLMYPPDPGEKLACVGGNVATNAGGMRAVKYGTTRDYVRAMTVVLPTGEITHFGATVSKTSSGYSLIDLMIGSEGTLGIITELTLKIIPAPKVITSMIVPFPDLSTAISNVPRIKNANLDPQALEFMEKEALLASERYIGKSTFPKEVDGVPANAYLLITFDGDSEEIVNDKIEQAVNIVMENGAIDVLIADTAPKMKDAWAARSSLLDAILEETKLLDECDVVVPVNEIADFLTFATKTGEECGLTIKSFGHAGDGNLHIYQCSNDLDEEEFKNRVEKYFHILYKKATEVGGLVSGEHGIGLGKIRFLEESIGKKNMELMYGIKKVFDPNLILNPGKVSYELGEEEAREAAIPALAAGTAPAAPAASNDALSQAAANVAQAAASVAQAAASVAAAALGQPVAAPAAPAPAAAPAAPVLKADMAQKREAPKKEETKAKPPLKGIAALKAGLAAKKAEAQAPKKEAPKKEAPKK
ncbi:MAG: FAD-binding oxidoreductase [Parasporobacterium sp.]|nr:FAD-binding oxidoreductase [Parasporobacterium sp.]